MNDLTRIYVVRHAESIFNANRDKLSANYDGSVGSPLSEKGLQQARDLAKKLNEVKFEAIFSSDLPRARQTAEIVALEKKLAIETSELIRERSVFEYLHQLNSKDFTDLVNRIRNDLKKLDEKAKMQYKHSKSMESAEEGATRLLNFIREAASAYTGKTIMVVCHGNIMRSLLTHLGFSKYDGLPSGAIENTGYFVLESDGTDFFIKETYKINKQEGKTRDF